MIDLVTAGLTSGLMAGMYVVAGVVPIVIYMFELKRKSKVPTIEVDAEEGLKTEAPRRLPGRSTISVSSSGAAVYFDGEDIPLVSMGTNVSVESLAAVESASLSPITEEQELLTSEDGRPSFIIRSRALREKEA